MTNTDVSTGGDVLLQQPVSGRTRVEAVKLPVSRYTSPAFFERELADVWPKAWQLACTVDHVANPGDWFEYECEHDNGVTRPVRRCGDSPNDANCTPGEPVPVKFGVTSVDEMCLLTGLFYTD